MINVFNPTGLKHIINLRSDFSHPNQHKFNNIPNLTLCEKCPNPEFFIYGPEKTPDLDTFHAVII